MFTYTPNTYSPLAQEQRVTVRPTSRMLPCRSPNYEFLCRSNFRPRLWRPADLTQSVSVHLTPEGTSTPVDNNDDRSTFTESVQTVPESLTGGRGFHPAASISSLQRQPSTTSLASDTKRRLTYNISSSDMRQRLQDRMAALANLRKSSKQLPGGASQQRSFTQSLAPSYSSGSIMGSTLSISTGRETLSAFHESLDSLQEKELQCSCKEYHCHVFKGRPVNMELVQETHKFIDTLTSQTKTEETAREDSYDDLRNIFWTPSLSFHPYKHGDKLVEFAELWPGFVELREHFENCGIQRTVLKDLAVLDLVKVSITCGPVRLLRCLIDLELVRVDQLVENGTGMLHLAVLSHNSEGINYLTSAKISPKLQDRSGKTADQLCYHSSVRRHLPPKYLVSREPRQTSDSRMVMKPSLQDKDVIFKLAANPKYFDEIQKKLQTLDFNVNTECDTNGDFLLHIVCRRGLSQLPLIMALVKIQGSDVELCNAEGETPLMLAAAQGNAVLCDVLMCLFGADPNKPNPNTGRTALHYAVEGNHRKTAECMIRRGADVNCEDHSGRRTDDIPLCQGTNDDCHEVIKFNRTCRMEELTERIRKGELARHHLLPTDLFVVDDDGYTLVMTAAIYNKPDALEVLLLSNDTTIDAQHIKTGMTALSIAAQMGNAEAVEVLLSRGANPAIADMKNYLPLHYAVLNNQEKVVDSMLEYFPQCYCGLYMATRLCKRTSIHIKLKSAFTRRQEEIVTPKLLACAMNGSADELYQLLDDGDNINPKSGSGNWPLYLAVQNGHLDVVKLLFEHGGDIRKRHSTTGETVLHVAAKMGHTETTRYLMQYCRQSPASASHRSSRKLMDINNTDANNRTPLQAAAEKGFSRIVELLLQHGATTALLDAGGQLITCPQFEGVRMQIESHRQQHTKDVVALITDRSKKALEQLKNIWLPRFDHNLRTRQGDTPLMVACASGKLLVVKMMLESAVYPPCRQEVDSDDDSDADSGVLDPSGRHFPSRLGKSSDGEDMQGSGVFSQSTEMAKGHLTNSGDFTQSVECIPESSGGSRSRGTELGLPRGLHNTQRSLDALLHDINRPKGLYIFHDGLVSHVCSVNLFDGSSALHRAMESGDNCQLVKVLLAADLTCLNMQNDAGLSPLHLACKLGRKKVVELLLMSEGVDVNARTLDSLLPEEMTLNKAIIRMVQKARIQHTGLAAAPPPKPYDADLNKDDASSTNTPSQTGSTVNFDKLHSRYEALRKGVKNTS